MKILLIQNSVYIPTYGGANKSNRLLLEGFAERHHLCRAVSPAIGGIQDSETCAQFSRELVMRGIKVVSSFDGVEVFRHKGVEVHAVTQNSQFIRHTARQIQEFKPTCVLSSSEDPGQALLHIALKTSSSPVVYLARTTSMLPFGPDSRIKSQVRTEKLRQTAGIIAVSYYIKDYIRRWSGMESVVLPISLLGSGPFPFLGDFEKGCVMMINPCAEKGGDIFVELARKLPNIQFGAVPTWGTTDFDLTVLKRLPNVRLFMPVDDIDEIFAQTRILLVPSLWAEAKARVVMEAMLRGIPVLASNVGGNPEAKLGIDYLLPVHPIERYEERRIGNQIGLVPVVPEQDVRPWLSALKEILSHRTRYEQVSAASREAALSFIENNGIELVEEFLENLVQSFQPHDQTASIQNKEQPTQGVLGSIRQLSPKQREILIRRLRRKGGKQ